MSRRGRGSAGGPGPGWRKGRLGAGLVRAGLSAGTGSGAGQGCGMGRPSLLFIRVAGGRERITGVHVGGRCTIVGGGWLDL